MKRILVACVMAALLAGVLPLPAAAGIPKCVDLQSTNSDGTQLSRAAYDGDTVAGQFFLRGKSCKKFRYTLVILDNEGDPVPLASGTVRGDRTAAAIEIFVSGVTVADGDACVYVISTNRTSKKTFDRAPADGCVVLLDDGTSPAGGKGF